MELILRANGLALGSPRGKGERRGEERELSCSETKSSTPKG